jgi:hypothetical protein
MKTILQIITAIALTFGVATAQTGNGITTQTSSPYNFTPTSVDSTTTVSVQFDNSVSATQSIVFSGLSAPYSISSDSISIPANGSVTVVISFNPTAVGNFTDTLSWNGSIFGNGSLLLAGEGVQVTITTSTDSLNLGSISLGTSVTDSFMISNTGTGTMAISNISSNNTDFTVSPTTAAIAQGASMYVSITYNPVLSGLSTATIAIASNDPNTPIYNITAIGSAVSQVSGNICNDLWIPANNPYLFTDNVYIPEYKHYQ